MSSSAPPSVVCAGIIVADHLCTPIDHLPAPGELVAADELVLNIGGCASNTAVDLARLGVRATICGKVGDDVFGQFVTAALASQGLDVRGLSVHPRLATSQTLIVNVQGQDRRFIHSFGANKALAITDLDAVLDAPPRLLYLGGYFLLPGLDPQALAERFAQLRQAGTLTMLDVVCPGPSAYLPLLEPVLPHTDIFLPNRDEAALILGETDPVRQARRFHELGARLAVITDGADGAVAWSDRLRVRLGAYPVTFIDGTGGGDAFDAGLIAGRLDGRSDLDCLKLASAVGASCVRAVGATPGVFTRPEADAFLAAHPLSVESLS